VSSLKVTNLRQFIQKYPAAVHELLTERENIVARNRRTGRVREVQIRALHQNNPRFWEQQETWEYFVDNAVARHIVEILRQKEEALKRRLAGEGAHNADGAPGASADIGGDGARSSSAPAANGDRGTDDGVAELEAVEDDHPRPAGDYPQQRGNFSATFDRYKNMERDERVGLLKRTTARLNELATRDDVGGEELANVLVDATQDATMTNRATLLEALRMGNEQARAYSQQTVIETHQMVKSTMRLVDSSVYNDDLVRAVVEKSNGTVVQHMTRVFLSGLEFLLYYNREVMMRGVANRLRIRFKREYKAYYRSLLPHLHEDYVSLEHVFLGGMKALSEVEINKFATGFLVHDVGKAEDIEYHEGEAEFDRATVERHVKLGYKAVMDKTNYPREAGLITGYHHEYYGHPNGYGYFREFLDAYKRANPAATQDYVMSYTIEPVIDYEVLAYFPAKMLEIVDVFDSLTDPNRKYRSPLSKSEALDMIREQFIEKNHKIDPILFTLFTEFFEAKWGPRAT
jgi:HD-GYP domain-containing protein (c-di-GMP phosphodiesterase class II)